MRRKVTIPIVATAILLCVVALVALDQLDLLPKKTYSAEDFNIEAVYSSVDFNGNGTDDYTDLLLGE